MRTLYIIRGMPGSGKSTLAKILAPKANHAADDYFERLGRYDPNHLHLAHGQCVRSVGLDMHNSKHSIAVANTFSQNWEMHDYKDLAKRYGYSVFVIECQNNFGSVHNVDEAFLVRCAQRWEANEQ